MSRATRITQAALPSMICPTGRSDVCFWDDLLPGFGLRAFASGKRTWVVQYRTPTGRQRRAVLGDVRVVQLEAARASAREMLARVALGQDPQGEREQLRRLVTVADVVADYCKVAETRLKRRTYVEVERALLRAAKPLHPLKADTVTRRDIVRLLEGVAGRSGPVAATRARAYLSAMWSWAIKTGHVEGMNPVAGTPRPCAERSRERVLSDAELTLIWRCTARGGAYDRIVRLLMLTAQRRDEVGASTWSEWALDNALWTLPADRTKNGLPHEVPVSNLTLAQLPARRNSTDTLFGSTTGFSAWSASKSRLDARMAKAMREDFKAHRGREPEAGEVVITPWRLHDLRRTFSTWANEEGAEPHVVEAMLNHVSGSARRGVAGVYNKASYRSQKTMLVMKWSEHVRDLISGIN